MLPAEGGDWNSSWAVSAKVPPARSKTTPIHSAHFWGIKPSDQLIQTLSVYPQSQAIKDLLIHYRTNVAPNTVEEYLVYHNQFPTDDYQFPRYEQYLLEFDSTFANAIDAQFELLMNLYFKEDMIFSNGFE